jgi:hypothetical protein
MSASDLKTMDEQRMKQIFRNIGNSAPEPSPFLKTRVLAQLREEQRLDAQKSWGSIFKYLTAGLVSALALVVSYQTLVKNSGALRAQSSRPVALRLETKDLKAKGVSHAKIELAEGMAFYSAQFPEIQEHRILDLRLENDEIGQPLAIVIRSHETGSKSVKVQFFDDNEQVVAERIVKIRFDRDGSSS